LSSEAKFAVTNDMGATTTDTEWLRKKFCTVEGDKETVITGTLKCNILAGVEMLRREADSRGRSFFVILGYRRRRERKRK
jgi:glutamate dehydrogenase/leucine dehydrogenase